MFLSPESKFFSFMSKLGDIIFLNILFIISCIPIFTIGASCCALYVSVKKRIYEEEASVLSDYKKSFKENFKSATIIFFLLLFCLILLFFFSKYIAFNLEKLFVLIIYLILFVILSFSMLYFFPLQSTFINTPLNIIKNSFLTAFKHFPQTIILFAVTYLPFVFTLMFPQFFYYTFVYWLFLGFSLCSIFSILITQKVFEQYK